MTPVYQRSVNDCLSAAIASVLNLELDSVPSFWELTGGAWLKAISDWAESRGLGVCYFSLRDRAEWPHLNNHYVIVAGDTPRSSEYFHCVVAQAKTCDGKTQLHFVHDPCRDGSYITNPDHCLFFVPGMNGSPECRP